MRLPRYLDSGVEVPVGDMATAEMGRAFGLAGTAEVVVVLETLERLEMLDVELVRSVLKRSLCAWSASKAGHATAGTRTQCRAYYDARSG